MDVSDLFDDFEIVLLVIDQVDRLRVHGEQRAVVVIVEKPGVGFGQALQVIVADLLLVIDAALGDALAQRVQWRLQVDHQVGPRRVERQLRVDLLVEREFVGVQRHLREQPVLVDHEIGDPRGLEQVGLAKILYLARALQQEMQLRR